MPLVTALRKKNANIVVEAYGEVLFGPAGPIPSWTRKFTEAVKTAARAEAPTNKRPRWAHYGLPLKATFNGTTKYQPELMRVTTAVGSSSPHAYYVDQGTGIYNGGSPYEAKILPPWTVGGASLYEASYRPFPRKGEPWRKVGTVTVKGQEGQHFFAKALRRGFETMGMVTEEVPGSPEITGIIGEAVAGMEDFLGNTVADGTFRAQLQEWRAWRDAAWNTGLRLGKPRQAHATSRGFRAGHAPVHGPQRRVFPKPPQAKTPKLSREARQKIAADIRAAYNRQGRTISGGIHVHENGSYTLVEKKGVRVHTINARWRPKHPHE